MAQTPNPSRPLAGQHSVVASSALGTLIGQPSASASASAGWLWRRPSPSRPSLHATCSHRPQPRARDDAQTCCLTTTETEAPPHQAGTGRRRPDLFQPAGLPRPPAPRSVHRLFPYSSQVLISNHIQSILCSGHTVTPSGVGLLN